MPRRSKMTMVLLGEGVGPALEEARRIGTELEARRLLLLAELLKKNGFRVPTVLLKSRGRRKACLRN